MRIFLIEIGKNCNLSMVNSFYISYEQRAQIMKKKAGKEAVIIMQREENRELVLPKNIRQMESLEIHIRFTWRILYILMYISSYTGEKKKTWYWQLFCWEKRCVRENRNMCLSAVPRR